MSGLAGLDSHQERVERINRFLSLCRENRWTYSTPNLAGKLEQALATEGFTKKTLEDYISSIIEILGTGVKNAQAITPGDNRAMEDALVEIVYQEWMKKGTRSNR